MARAKGQKLPNSIKDRVAELLAEGIDAAAIGERLGISRKSVSARFSEIRRDLGWQAA